MSIYLHDGPLHNLTTASAVRIIIDPLAGAGLSYLELFLSKRTGLDWSVLLQIQRAQRCVLDVEYRVLHLTLRIRYCSLSTMPDTSNATASAGQTGQPAASAAKSAAKQNPAFRMIGMQYTPKVLKTIRVVLR